MGEDDQYAGQLEIIRIFALEYIAGMYLFSAGRLRIQLYPIRDRASWMLRFTRLSDDSWTVAIGPIEVGWMIPEAEPVPPSGES